MRSFTDGDMPHCLRQTRAQVGATWQREKTANYRRESLRHGVARVE